jgi:cell division transport system permease protein
VVRIKLRRKKASYFSPLVSITLVLFLTGLFGLLIFYADKLKDFLKENVQVSIIFRDDTKEPDIFRIQKMMQNETFIIKTDYVSKDEARKIMIKELGEDAVNILGFNPFPSSLDVYFKASYAQVDSIDAFKVKMEKYPFVKEVSYQRVILENIDKNVKIIATVILGFMLIFLLIAIVLINNTIRLTLFSKRFLIKSMQLVGATQGFIRKPFIIKAINFGILGGVIANILLAVLIYLLNKYLPYTVIGNFKLNILLALLLIVFGIIITFFSSYFSVKRYLKLKLDDLY